MTDNEILEEMIKPEVLIPLEGGEDKPRVILTEKQAPGSRVVISELPPDVLIMKVDMFKSPDLIFCGNKKECRRADYVIISPQKKCIVYLEVKRNHEGESHFISQLKGAKCFVKYCEEIGKEFWKEENFLCDYKHWFIGIGHSNLKKSGTRNTRFTQTVGTHNSPENFLKIDWAKNLVFNHLIGKGT